MSDNDTDRQLVARTQGGDLNAFNWLVLRYQHKVSALVGRYLGNPTDVEDVCQEVFVKAYRALASFRGDSAFYTWLYRIAVNEAKNHLSARGRHPPAADIDYADAEQAADHSVLQDIDDPQGRMATGELRRVIIAAVAGLPPELRVAFSLREFTGLSYEEITEVLDCPAGTVRSRIARARAVVDKQVREHLESG